VIVVITDNKNRFVILKGLQIDVIPKKCANCFSADIHEIFKHIDGNSWICMTCNYLTSFEPSLKLSSRNFPFVMSGEYLNQKPQEIFTFDGVFDYVGT